MSCIYLDYGANVGGADFPVDLDYLFANGEIGDWWLFDPPNTDAEVHGDLIRSAVGLANGRVLGQVDPLHVPTLHEIDLGAGGHWTARFHGGGERLAHAFGGNVAQPGTIIIAFGDSVSGAQSYATGSSTTSRWQVSCDSSANLIAFAGATLDSTINLPVDPAAVFTAEFNGASSKFRRNGVQVATGNTGAQVTNQLTVGALWDGTAGNDVNIYNILFINRLLTADELNKAERTLGFYGGILW